MNLANRFWVFTKRIFSKAIYVVLLVTIVVLTATYMLLPEKKQSSNMRVALSCDYDTPYIELLFARFEDINTMYEFYVVDSSDKVMEDVKSGYAHCGFAIPAGFFESYITGDYKNPLIMYDTPVATFSAAISETLFSCIIQVCSPEILSYTIDKPEYDEELKTYINGYLYSDSIFSIESLHSGEYNYKEESYKVNIPVFQIVLLIAIFSGLLGLLTFMQDSEKNIYVALPRAEVNVIKLTNIVTAVLPIMITGVLCLVVMGQLEFIVKLVAFNLITIVLCYLISFIIKKSSVLLKILPLIMLGFIVLVFVDYLI